MVDIEEKGIGQYPKRPAEDIEQGRTCAEQTNCLNCPWVSECYREDYDDEDYYDGFDD